MAFTYFFRDRQTLEAIRDLAVPKLRTRRYIHVWDAGCAMGPEPYSLAIILRESMGGMCFRNVTIHATDIDTSKQFAGIIHKAEYSREQLKSVPRDIFDRYFEKADQNGSYRLCREIRERLSFQRHDLLTLHPIRSNVSLIVCKNVLLHFTEEQRIAVLQMFHACLEEGGYLVTEQTQKLPPQVAPLFSRLQSKAQIFQKTRS